MIWYHNHPELQCFVDIGDSEYNRINANHVLYGTILYVMFNAKPQNNWHVGSPISPIKKYGRLATEDDLIKLNKLMVFS